MALRDAVARDLAATVRMANDARDEATGTESRAENVYDTRATEASYLAAGQGRRLVGLPALLTWLEQLDGSVRHDEVVPGALVALRRGTVTEWALVGVDTGPTVVVGGVEVRLLSERSPAGE